MSKANKTDTKLGYEIESLLKNLKIHTPTTKLGPAAQSRTSIFRDALESIGLDLADDSLSDTPSRIAKMWDEIFYGLHPENFPKCTTVENKMHYSGMVCVDNIRVRSMCEHHFVPFIGTARIAYIPEAKLLGLSKFNRIVDYFSRRPQVQERLTDQIFESLKYILETKNVALVIKANHMCVALRGVEDAGSITTTARIGGKFRKGKVRQEFFSLTGES